MQETLKELPKNLKILYRPRGEAEEYGTIAANIYRGCPHRCAYCYCPQVLRMPRQEFYDGGEPRVGVLAALERDAVKCAAAGISEQVFLCFTTDPYHPKDTTTTREAIRILQAHGQGVCTLTKGGTRALRDLDIFRPGRDAFACTLTGLDEDFARKWEPGAATPSDRLSALRAFHRRGIFTWVSMEPTLDVKASEQIVRETCGFVDLYKIGRANYISMTRTTDWAAYARRMVDVVAENGARAYFKRSLQEYLPAGYVNEMRVQQHH